MRTINNINKEKLLQMAVMNGQREAHKRQQAQKYSYEKLNQGLTRYQRQRCNLNRTSHAFKSKSSQCNCHSGSRH